MEVHHHSHSSGKKWTHYLWEFLMLFLAVFSGFLAENLREHVVELNREKQFIHSICEDLKSDTAQLGAELNFRKMMIRNIDSVLYYLNMPDPDKYGKFVYHYVRPISNSSYFISNDRTIQQLKNAGNLRLIRNQQASDLIMRYDLEVRRNEVRIEREEKFKMDNIEAMNRVFNGNEFNGMLNKILIDKKSGFPQKFQSWPWPESNPPLIHKDKENIQRLINSLVFTKTINAFYLEWNNGMINRASMLLEFLKKEYHIK